MVTPLTTLTVLGSNHNCWADSALQGQRSNQFQSMTELYKLLSSQRSRLRPTSLMVTPNRSKRAQVRSRQKMYLSPNLIVPVPYRWKHALFDLPRGFSVLTIRSLEGRLSHSMCDFWSPSRVSLELCHNWENLIVFVFLGYQVQFGEKNSCTRSWRGPLLLCIPVLRPKFVRAFNTDLTLIFRIGAMNVLVFM